MNAEWKRLIDFLKNMGVEKIGHTHKNYLAHVVAVSNDMRSAGCGEDACRAALFHSIYGTERFQGFTLPLEQRAEIRALAGERVERLAYLNCAMDRASFDEAARGTPPYRFRDRLSGEIVQISADDFDDLCRLHLYDWLEQVPRSQCWDYRRDAYRRLAERLGEPARSAYAQVFAQAPVPAEA